MSGMAVTRLPLAGKRVLVTRPRCQMESLSDLLRQEGAEPVEFPVIEIVPSTGGELDAALAEIEQYDWLVFTSVNAVTIIGERLNLAQGVKIAAVGDRTARALTKRGVEVDLVPAEFVAEAVLDALIELGVAGKRFLLPLADIARTTLADGLREAGAIVDVVETYSTQMPTDVDQDTLMTIQRGDVDIVTVTSPSAVWNLRTLLGGALPAGVMLACIGPVTAAAAREVDLRVDVVADEYSIPGLVRALTQTGETIESESI